MTLISSANVACGGHAGDDASMTAVCESARNNGVAVGAQVSYPDREHFGRVAISIANDALADSLERQFNDLAKIAQRSGVNVTYIKPHGALYNTVVTNPDHARVVVQLAARHGIALFGLRDSCTATFSRDEGVRFISEWFADRAYLASGQLVPRSRTDALVTKPAEVRSRTLNAVRNHQVRVHNDTSTVAAEFIDIDFATICVHSDTPGAAHLLRAVHAALSELGVAVGAP